MNRRNGSLIALTLILGAAATVALARATKTVLYHGAVVSTDISVINGTPYVPLADMARALGGKATARANGYEIVTSGGGGGDTANRTAAGGTNEVRGQNGKVGDWFFNGYWRFQVKSVEHTSDPYQFHFATAGSEKPNSPNDELVILTCEIRNGHQGTEVPILGTNGTSAQKTALTDDQGQSYPPLDFDVKGGPLIQGAARSFAVLFSVPKGTHLKDLVFTLYGSGESYAKASNVRVSLNP